MKAVNCWDILRVRSVRIQQRAAALCFLGLAGLWAKLFSDMGLIRASYGPHEIWTMNIARKADRQDTPLLLLWHHLLKLRSKMATVRAKRIKPTWIRCVFFADAGAPNLAKMHPILFQWNQGQLVPDAVGWRLQWPWMAAMMSYQGRGLAGWRLVFFCCDDNDYNDYILIILCRIIID